MPTIELIGCKGLENHFIVGEIRQEMAAKLASEECRYGIAIHETGHYMYFKKAGYENFNFKLPRITFCDGAFTHQMASVEAIRDDTSAAPALGDVVLGYAKALAAGGEFTRSFAPAIHPGDEGDRIIFDKWFEAQDQADSALDAGAYWGQAQESVRLRLQDPDFRARAIQECQFVYSKLFSWAMGSRQTAEMA